jgi:SAM-dependent methyltransferase
VGVSLPYRIMYALGFTPWRHEEISPQLCDLVQSISPGRALDIGCGTGTEAIWLAQHGFEVVGIDITPKAIFEARRRAEAAGAHVELHVADASKLDGLVKGPFSLIVDIGCMHSVPDAVRDGLARACTELAAPGADYLLQAFAPRKGFGPKGLGRDEIERRLGENWRIVQQVAVTSLSLPRFLRDATASWYWLRRT